MPYTEERIDAVETDITKVKGDIHHIKNVQILHSEVLARLAEHVADLRTGQGELRSGQDELRKGQDEIRIGQDDLRTRCHELRDGQNDLRTKYQELRDGQNDLRTKYQELRDGQNELCRGLDDLRSIVERNNERTAETFEEFRAVFNIVLDEVQAQKAWREEFSSKVARLIAKSEGNTRA